MRPGFARFGPPADHEFLLGLDLELPPVGRPFPGFVARVGPLRDQSFPSARHRARVQLPSVAADLLAQPENGIACLREEFFKSLAPSRERQLAQILLTVLQKVERDKRRRHIRRRPADVAASPRSAAMNDAAEMNASLKVLKTGRKACSIERDDLTVEHDGLAPLCRP